MPSWPLSAFTHLFFLVLQPWVFSMRAGASFGYTAGHFMRSAGRRLFMAGALGVGSLLSEPVVARHVVFAEPVRPCSLSFCSACGSPLGVCLRSLGKASALARGPRLLPWVWLLMQGRAAADAARLAGASLPVQGSPAVACAGGGSGIRPFTLRACARALPGACCLLGSASSTLRLLVLGPWQGVGTHGSWRAFLSARYTAAAS